MRTRSGGYSIKSKQVPLRPVTEQSKRSTGKQQADLSKVNKTSKTTVIKNTNNKTFKDKLSEKKVESVKKQLSESKSCNNLARSDSVNQFLPEPENTNNSEKQSFVEDESRTTKPPSIKKSRTIQDFKGDLDSGTESKGSTDQNNNKPVDSTHNQTSDILQNITFSSTSTIENNVHHSTQSDPNSIPPTHSMGKRLKSVRKLTKLECS